MTTKYDIELVAIMCEQLMAAIVAAKKHSLPVKTFMRLSILYIYCGYTIYHIKEMQK